MYVKKLTYKDFNDVERTEDFYFSLTEAEALEMELTTPGGVVAMLQKIIDEKDIKKMIEFWKKFLLMAYGEKSADGRYFVKDEKTKEMFTYTKAYSDLFVLFSTNDVEAAKFVRGILPGDISNEDLEKAMKDAGLNTDGMFDEKVSGPQAVINSTATPVN